MPIRIEANTEGVPTLNRVTEQRGYDNSFGLNILGRGIEAAGQAVAYGLDKKNLQNAQEDVDAIMKEAQGQTNVEGSNIHALREQMFSADEGVVQNAYQELYRLRTAREQGLLPSQELEIRANNVVKWYANQYPHLGREIRAIGAMANDNFTAAARSTQGKDPIVDAQEYAIKQAFAEGKTPHEWIVEQGRLSAATLATKTAEALKLDKDLKREPMFIAIQNANSATLQQRSFEVLKSLDAVLTADPTIPFDKLKGQLDREKLNDIERLRAYIGKYEADTGIALEKSQRDTLFADINSSYESLNVQLGAFNTEKARADWIKTRLELGQNLTKAEFIRVTGESLWSYQAANDPELFMKLSAAGMQHQVAMERLIRINPDTPEGRTAAEDQFVAIYGSDPFMMQTHAMVRNGDFDHIMKAALGDLWKSGKTPETGLAAVDRETVRLSLDAYDKMPYGDRKTSTAPLTSGLTYAQIIASPTLLMDIRNDPAATRNFMGKLTDYFSGRIGEAGSEQEMVFNFSNYDNPIQFAVGQTQMQAQLPGVRGGPPGGALAGLNEAYRIARNTLSSQDFNAWIEELKRQGMGVSQLGPNIPDVVTGKTAANRPTGPRVQPRPSQPFQLPSMLEASQQPAVRNTAGGDFIPKTPEDYATYDYENTPVMPGDITEPTELVNFVVQQGEKMGVPQWLTRAFAEYESSNGKELVGVALPATKNRPAGHRATGVMHIIPQTFEGINDQNYGGRLDFRYQTDKALASVTFLADLYRKYGNDIDSIAGEYFGGPDFQYDRDDTLTKTSAYIAKIRSLVDKYGG